MPELDPVLDKPSPLMVLLRKVEELSLAVEEGISGDKPKDELQRRISRVLVSISEAQHALSDHERREALLDSVGDASESLRAREARRHRDTGGLI